MSSSLRTQGLQHARLLCSSLSPRVGSNSCTESMMSSNHLVLSHLLLLLPSIFPCIRIFSNELGLCIRWPKYWNFSFSISLSNEYSELISFRTIFISLQSKGLSRVFSNKSYSSKASILRHSAFFMVQLSHPYITTGKTIALTIQTFVGKVMSLLIFTVMKKKMNDFSFIFRSLTKIFLKSIF